MASIAAVGNTSWVRPRFRLRYVLFALGMSAAVAWGLPRARAAWSLHDTAGSFADYGLCMAGPTGATLLRDQPDEFWRLVRRRLVASSAEDKTFSRCASLVANMGAAPSATDWHNSRASDFREWGKRDAPLTLTDLAGALPDLSVLADSAWPFLRHGVRTLIKPSLGAKEAIHPVQSVRPGTLSGLRLYGSLFRARRVNDKGWFVVLTEGENIRALRSRDRAKHWAPTSPWQTSLEGTVSRCSSESGEHSFGLEPRRTNPVPTLTYYSHGTRTGQASMGEAPARVLSLACDAAAAVAVAESANGQLSLWLCLANEPCKLMPLPPILGQLRAEGVDVARLQGASVVAITAGDLVRVVSTRDDGQVYAPPTVALDHRDGSMVEGAWWPAQLLALGSVLLLTQDAKNGAASSLAIISGDFGASWRPFGESATK